LPYPLVTLFTLLKYAVHKKAHHQVDEPDVSPTYALVNINDASDVQKAAMTTGITKFNFISSCVKQSAVKAGYVQSTTPIL